MAWGYVYVDNMQAGDTALILTASKGYLDIVELLVKHGIDIHAKNNEKKTALHVAAEFHHSTIVDFLLAHGANINSKDKVRFSQILQKTMIVQEPVNFDFVSLMVSWWHFHSQLKRMERLLLHLPRIRNAYNCQSKLG